MQQQVAPLDCLDHLAGPPAKGNRGAAAVFGGQLLAYAAASAVVVVDVSGAQLGWVGLWAWCGWGSAPGTLAASASPSAGAVPWARCPGEPHAAAWHESAHAPRTSAAARHGRPPPMLVQRMAAATTLAGAHRQAAVSALAW